MLLHSAEAMSTTEKAENSGGSDGVYDVIIIGAGAAGVGVAISIQHTGIENYLLVDRDCVGSSFASWPAETRFILSLIHI